MCFASNTPLVVPFTNSHRHSIDCRRRNIPSGSLHKAYYRLLELQDSNRIIWASSNDIKDCTASVGIHLNVDCIKFIGTVKTLFGPMNMGKPKNENAEPAELTHSKELRPD